MDPLTKIGMAASILDYRGDREKALKLLNEVYDEALMANNAEHQIKALAFMADICYHFGDQENFDILINKIKSINVDGIEKDLIFEELNLINRLQRDYKCKRAQQGDAPENSAI